MKKGSNLKKILFRKEKMSEEKNMQVYSNLIKSLLRYEPGSFLNFQMDYLQEKVFHNLHFEFPQIDPSAIIKPSLDIKSSSDGCMIKELLADNQEFFQTFRRCVIDNIIEYSAILESNSYFLHNNEFLLISRSFFNSGKKRTMVRNHFYTIEPRDITAHYNDKIYCGTDSFIWEKQKRKFSGLLFFAEVVLEGMKNLDILAPKKLKEFEKYRKIHLDEMNDLVQEFYSEGCYIIEEYLPAYQENLSKKTPDLNVIIKKLREIKHYLIELVNLVAEFESLLIYRNEFDFAKYISKYKKDLTTFLNYLNIRLLRRLLFLINQKI